MIKILLIVLMLLFPLNAYSADISAKSAILIEQSTKKILYENNAYAKMKPASTTKILTAICAVENGILNDIVTVSKNAAHSEGSSMYLKEGEKITLENLVYGLMLNSGNDAAVAIAEHIGGSVENFANIMNNKARDIGAVNSNFVNPNGLDHEDHYTTAYDLAIITAYSLKNEIFAKIVKTKSKVVSTIDGVNKYLTNHNKLLNIYNGCTGVKTGFTKASGRTLVSSAIRDNMQLICITMNAPNDWNDHRNLLDYGFLNYCKHNVLSANEVLEKVNVKNGVEDKIEVYSKEGYYEIIHKNSDKKYKFDFKYKDLKAPILEDEIVGKLYIRKGNEIIFKANLFANRSIDKIIKKLSFFDILKRFVII